MAEIKELPFKLKDQQDGGSPHMHNLAAKNSRAKHNGQLKVRELEPLYLRNSRTTKTSDRILDIDDFVQRILHSFKQDRIVCLLHYGSSTNSDSGYGFNDVDFYLMLNEFAMDDYRIIKDLHSYHPCIDLTFQYQSDVTSKPWNSYQLGNHGVFYLFVFASAKCLIGSNPFCKAITLIPHESVERSLLYQIEEHLWRLDDFYVSSNHTPAFYAPYFRKYLWRSAIHILIVSGCLTFEQLNHFSGFDILQMIQEASHVFSTNTRYLFFDLFQPEYTPEVSLLIATKRSLHLDYLALLKRTIQ